MRKFMLFVCSLFLLSAFTPVKDAGRIFTISTDLQGDLFIASSDNPNDLLVSIKVYDSARVLKAETSCGLSMNCQINLSSLPSGTYLAKVFSQNDAVAEYIYLD